jgi:beta-glucosidase
MIPAGEQLKRFQKVKIPAGQTKEVRFVLNKEDLMFVNEAGEWVFEPGKFNFSIGTKKGSVVFK